MSNLQVIANEMLPVLENELSGRLCIVALVGHYPTN